MRPSSLSTNRRLRKSPLHLAILAAVCCSGTLSQTHADTWTWNGGGASVGNFFWSDPANWTHTGGSSSPVSNSATIVSFAGSTGPIPNQDIATPFILNSLNFQSGTAAFQLSGNVLDFATNAGVTPTIVQNSASGDVILNAVTLNDNTTLSGSGTGGLIFLGNITGSSSLTITSGGNMTLLGTNTYAGGTTINGGTVVIGSSSSLGTGNLTFTSGNLIAGNVTLTSNFTTNNSGAMGFQANAGTTFIINPNTALFGSMNFGSATNTGTINFEPGSFGSFGGTINVNGGTLLDGADALGQTLQVYTVNIASGATLNLNGFSTTVKNLTGSGNFVTGTDASQNVTLTSGNFSGIISGAGSLVTTGSTVILSGPNTYTGGSILGGGNFGAGNNAALSTQVVIVTGNTSLYAVGSTITLANQIFFSTAQSLTIINNPGGAQNLILSGNISGNGGIIMSGTGSLKLSGNNSYSGNTTLNSGELIINNNNSLGTGTLNFIGGAVTASADATLTNYTTQSATSSVTFRATAATTLTLGGGTIHLDGANLIFGSPGFTGTVNVSPANVFGTPGANLSVNAGTLRNGDGVLAIFLSNDIVTVAAGAKLDLNNFSTSIASLLGGGNITTGNDPNLHLTLITANFSGNISGSGQLLTASNSTTVILSSANTYTGPTTFAGGTLGFGNNSALSTGNISLTGNTSLYAAAADRILANKISLASTKTLTITNDPNGPHNLTLSGNITGAGGLTMSGTASLTLSGNNTYVANTTLTSGEIIIHDSHAFGTGTLIMNGGTVTATGNATITNLNNTAATAPITLQANAGQTLTIVGALNTGSTDINFGSATNTGTMNYSASAGNFQFATHYNVNGGTLFAGNGNLGGVLVTEYVTIAPAATVDFNGTNGGFGQLLGSGTVKTGNNPAETLSILFANFSGNITGSGQLITVSGGNITLAGASNYSGGSNFAGGLIHAGNDSAFGSGPITVTSTTGLFPSAASRTLSNAISINADQALLTQNDPVSAFNLTLTGPVSGEGTLTQTGPGALTLNGLLTVSTLNIGNSPLTSNVVLQTPSTTANKISSLNLFSTSTLDLTASRLIIEDTSANRPSDLTTLKNEAAAHSIFSSTLPAGQVVVVSDNAIRLAAFGATASNFNGGTNNVDANSILLTATFLGDANLDGVVDIKDLQDLANHWQQPATDWSQADFDGNGIVALQDLQALANHWQAGVGAGGGSGQSFADALALIGQFNSNPSPVPEPAALSLMTLGTIGLLRRRK